MPKYEGSFKQKCEALGVNYNNARAYKKKHKGISDDIILEQYINMLNSEKITIADICKKANIDSGLYQRIKFNNKELSSEEIIQKCREHVNKRTFAERCRELGINERAATLYKSRHKLSDDEVIQIYINRKKTFSEKCQEAGVDYKKAVRIKSSKNLSEEEAIKRALEVKKTLKDKCKEAEISYGAVITCRRKYNLTDDEAIRIVKNNQNNFKNKCKENNINYSKAIQYRQSHPELTDEQVIEYYKNKVYAESIAEVCRKYNVNANSVVTYMSRTGCTLKECIIHFRPDLSINIFGEIVEV